LECETFLEKLEDKRSKDSRGSGGAKRVSARTANDSSRKEPQKTSDEDKDSGVAGYRVMLYGYSTDKSEAAKILRRVAGLDELRAEYAMRSAFSFGAGEVDEFMLPGEIRGGRDRAIKAAKKSADELAEKLKKEGMMVEVEPLNLLT
jgi:hypothetical protein